jgi:hypothetical protein
MRFIDRIFAKTREKAGAPESNQQSVIAARSKSDTGIHVANAPAEMKQWKTVGVYFHQADGRHPGPVWADTPEKFNDLIPDIRRQIESKLELRITNGDDHLLFHSTKNGVEWDGIGLRRFLEHHREVHQACSRQSHDTSPDR